MNQDPLEFQPLTRRELCTVVGIILLAQFVMFSCGSPVPHQDASQYFEPGILLAMQGKLARPCDQYYDLSYKIVFFAYPPGFSLIVAAWVKIFGYTERSMLSFTHVQHALLLTTIWILARSRFRASRISAALAVMSLFPFHHHGRPDLTSNLFAALAWWIIPVSGIGMRLLIAGILLGLSVLTSLHYGSSAAAAVGTYAFIACNQSFIWRITRLSVLIALAVLINITIISLLLNYYDAWAVAYCQFTNHLQIRGSELNKMPLLFNFYMLRFCLVPLVLCTLLPLVLSLVIPSQYTAKNLRISALCYLVGFFVWFSANKTTLLQFGHFAYLATPLFHASLLSAHSRILRKLGYASCSLFALIHLNIESRDFVLLFENPRPAWDECRKISSGNLVVATDGAFFLSNYKLFNTISYESYRDANRWNWYRNLWPQELRERFDDVFRPGPQEPDVIIITTGTNEAYGPPDTKLFRRVDQVFPVRRYELFGIRTSHPTNYYHPVIYVKTKEPT